MSYGDTELELWGLSPLINFQFVTLILYKLVYFEPHKSEKLLHSQWADAASQTGKSNLSGKFWRFVKW